MGTNMRKNQHHTIFESGFAYGIGILMRSKTAAGAKFDESVVVDANASTNGRACYKLTVTDKNFHYYSYTAQAGETTYKLANSKNICEYLIVEKNSFIKDYSTSIAGKVLSIPSGYAPKTIIYIDKQNLLPISLEMDDEKGLLEKYEFLDIKINPTFSAEEFTKDYDDYGF
jgi:outer membrane lipoprotein-sorting protein